MTDEIEMKSTEKKFKYGCPYCGKNVGGSPTDSGFQWDICTKCLGHVVRAEQGISAKPDSRKKAVPPAGPVG